MRRVSLPDCFDKQGGVFSTELSTVEKEKGLGREDHQTVVTRWSDSQIAHRKERHKSLNPCRCHCECLSHVFFLSNST